jgi:ElaB/YqjD/DUF883 family membrane-anchored ribosome-binding protein
MSQHASPTADDRLVGELHEVVGEAEALLKATATSTGAGSRELRARVQASLDQARQRLHDLQGAAVERAKAAGKATDEYVHANPWQAMGVAALAGIAIGLLLGRRR